jgi:hypothetical protein
VLFGIVAVPIGFGLGNRLGAQRGLGRHAEPTGRRTAVVPAVRFVVVALTERALSPG